MIALDTNVLVRHLMGDDPTQSPIAHAAMARLTPFRPGYISLVVLVETLWVLRRSFRVSRESAIATVRALMETRDLSLQEPGVVAHALALAEQSGAEVPDALIAALAQGAGCEQTWTFDWRAARRLGMELLAGS
ncbi:MAG: type II toxin-antitoxin system VapC family toxin [Bifidobacteriaceae bacterium]|jgi:predicted nucleic-acid-binding protein|nr:type II toxin-antitoxin system VapC family toxin [Bifidobacteriaceae bacterium]